VKAIWKYPLEVADEQTIAMPRGAVILGVQAQRGIPCLWAMVETDEPHELRRIYTFGTGEKLGPPPMQGLFSGTYQLNDGDLVLHVFEEIPA